jgi:hypothetical protein
MNTYIIDKWTTDSDRRIGGRRATQVAVKAVMDERESNNTARGRDPQVTYILKSIVISKPCKWRGCNWNQTSSGCCIVATQFAYRGIRVLRVKSNCISTYFIDKPPKGVNQPIFLD